MSGTASPRLLPFEPVARRLAGRVCSKHEAPFQTRCIDYGCDTAIAEALGVSRRTVIRYKTAGLTIYAADELACALDTHPGELWGLDAWGLACAVHDDLVEVDA